MKGKDFLEEWTIRCLISLTKVITSIEVQVGDIQGDNTTIEKKFRAK